MCFTSPEGSGVLQCQLLNEHHLSCSFMPVILIPRVSVPCQTARLAGCLLTVERAGSPARWLQSTISRLLGLSRRVLALTTWSAEVVSKLTFFASRLREYSSPCTLHLEPEIPVGIVLVYDIAPLSSECPMPTAAITLGQRSARH